MKGIVSVLAVLTLAGMAYAQQPQVYTPSGSDATVPTFMNADVVGVDTAGRTITIRADNRDTVLAVEGEGLGALWKLRPGDQVMIGYRVDGGRRVVTNIREVVPTTTATATAAAPSRSTTIESVRVVAVNPSKRTLTVRDLAGKRHVLTTTAEAGRTLRGLRVGDDVVLSYRAGKGNARTVVRIEPVGVGTAGTVTQVPVAPVSTVVPVAAPAVVPATSTNVPVVVTQAGLPATGGIPVPPNAAGAPAILQPVPNVGPPTSPTLNVALPPANAGTMPEAASAAQADAIRAQSIRDLQAAAGVLALKANEADNLWFAFKSQCLGGTTPSGANTTTGREWFILLGGGSTLPPPSDDACRQRLADLNRCATLFQQQLEVARDAARRADVPPGTVREILQRNRLDR